MSNNKKNRVDASTRQNINGAPKRESPRQRRERHLMESNWEFAQARMKYLAGLGIDDNIYLESSKCEQLQRDVQEAINCQSEVSKLAQLVDLLCMEIFEVETSIVADANVTDGMIDGRLIGIREMLELQSLVKVPCRLTLEPKCARLTTASDNQDTFVQKLNQSLYPNGAEIFYQKGCAIKARSILAM